MSEKTATIIGSTGMTGSLLLEYLLQDPDYDYVRILVRRPVPITHEKLEVKLVNFNDTESFKLALDGSDVVFGCIGTTNKNVHGNKQLYWKIDHDITVNACQLAMETGCKKMVFISAIGSNPRSKNFYIRLKGKIEEDVIATGMPHIHIMQPGMLTGIRKEHRPFENTMQKIMKQLSKIMGGSLSKYKSIDSADVAKAMIVAASKNETGVFRHTYTAMKELADQFIMHPHRE